MIENKKYLIWPGYVRSQHDGQLHYITAPELIRLYGVAPHDCVVMPMEDSAAAANRRKQLASLHNLVPLHPRGDGNYQLPK